MQPGTTIDRYTVEAELGMGGMAAVYRVRHRTLGTLHALKVLTIGRRSIRERLVQEGVLQARLAHPNIVAVTDVLDVDGAPGLLMEFIPGGSLEDLLTRQLPDLDEAERLFRGILAAVEHAHAQGVIHRDLKPANVLLAEGPEGAVPKVADFGLARVLGETPSGIRATRTGMAMGTPSYMSPEQIRDAKGVDERTDVFALGCILYELVTGRVAFEGPDMLTIFNRITSGSFPPIQSLADDVPERVHAAIVGALQVDADRRLPSCAALRRVLDGTPLKTVLPPPPARPSRPPADRPGSAPSTLVYDERREVETPPAPRRRGMGVIVLGALFGASLVLVLSAAAALAWVVATGGIELPPPEDPVPLVTDPTPPEDPPEPPPEDPPDVDPPDPEPSVDPVPEPPDDPPPVVEPRPKDPTPKPRPVEPDPPDPDPPEPPVEDPPVEDPPEPRPVVKDPPRDPGPAPTDRFKPQPVSDFPSCDRLVRCFDALAVAEEPLRGMYASGIEAMLDAVKTMVRMDGVGDFSAEAQCAEMMSSYGEGFASLRQVEMYADLVPRACRF